MVAPSRYFTSALPGLGQFKPSSQHDFSFPLPPLPAQRCFLSPQKQKNKAYRLRTSKQFGAGKKNSASPMTSPNSWSKTGLGLKGDSPDTALPAPDSPQPCLSMGGHQEAPTANPQIPKTPLYISNAPGSTQAGTPIEPPSALACMPMGVIDKQASESQRDARKLSPTASSFQPSSSFLVNSRHGALGGSYAPLMSPYAAMTSQLSSAELGVSRHLLFTSSSSTIIPADVDVFMEVSASGQKSLWHLKIDGIVTDSAPARFPVQGHKGLASPWDIHVCLLHGHSGCVFRICEFLPLAHELECSVCVRHHKCEPASKLYSVARRSNNGRRNRTVWCEA